MINGIILDSPFVQHIMHFSVIDERIEIENLREKIVFQIVKKPIFKYLNLVKVQGKKLNFIAKEIFFKKIE